MKMKQMILLAMSAVLGVFGAGRVMAAEADTYLLNKIRIESIKKVAADGQVNLPLSPETTSTVYFDVKLTDITASGAKAEFTANGYDASASNNHDRPYLVLDIPLKGMSTKSKATLADGEAAAVETASAVAYYVSQGATPDILRFAYDVRPGDMTDELTWAVKPADDAMAGEPQFGGSLAAIRLSLRLPDIPQAQNVGLVESVLQGKDTAVAPDTATVWPVGGYTITIGSLTDPNDLNNGQLYQGLVPVTVSTKDGRPAATFANKALATSCYFWVEAQAADGSWKYAPAAVTLLRNADTTILEADYANAALSDTFDAAAYAKFTGANNSSATEFAPQTFFVNIPASLAAETNGTPTKVRLCYGVRRDHATAENLYTYVEAELQPSPVAANTLTSGYEVSCGEMDAGDFVLPESGLKYPALHSTATAPVTVSGGTINAAAGEKVVLTIVKNNIDQLANYGTLYASIELISTTNTAKAAFDRYYIPLDPNNLSEGYTATLTLGAQAALGDTYYRIRIPQLEAVTDKAVDQPFYLKVASSPKRETITLTEGVTGTMGTEHYQPADPNSTAPGSATFLQYTLSVPVSTSNRYFKIFPVAYDMETPISKDAVFEKGTQNERNVHEVLKRYVKLQNQGGSILPASGPELVVSVPAGATAATFYAACINDFPLNEFSGTVTELNGTTYQMSGALFIAKSCSSNGTITGTNDICQGILQPNVQNRAPTITSGSPPTSGATGTALNFSFNVVDTYSDYLVVQMNYGDGEVQTFLYASDAEMEAIMGEAAWEAQLATIQQLYGGTLEDYKTGGDRRRERSTLGSELVTFTHTYTSASNPTWNFSVTDSSMMMASLSGQLTLQTSQLFTFYTVTNATVPATGYVRWSNQTGTPDDGDFGWSFGETYTYNALTKSGGSTSVMVQAVPFSAGANTPAGYTPVDAARDSFFYKWAARHADYEALLPTGENLYERILSINRAFVAGGGEADDSSKWQDIVLGAIFVAEWLPSDALESYSKSRTEPYLYELGDYNQDGIPDGWLLRTLGAEAGRTAAEGVNIAGNAPEGDTLPAAGWGNGDLAYRWQPAGTQLNYNKINGPGPFAAGTAFDNLTRLRGRRLPGWPNALHATDGRGNWLSMPIWAVGVPSDAEDTDWRMIPLFDGSIAARAGVTIDRTEMGIPYDADQEDGEDWAPVVDAGGAPIDLTGAYADLYTIEVQTNPESDDYETFRCTLAGATEGTPAPGGLLLDESFSGTDPLRFSWLSRFAPNNADVDGDGVSNGMEYYFWYYASRMAWAPTLTDADGNVQIVKDAWPFIDPAKIREPNTDDNCGTTEVFVMGRKYRNAYNPDSATNSFYADRDNASAGKGNYWEPITVAEVLNHFNPYEAGAGGDLDNDGLGTIEEILNGTNPIDCDTDNDWMPDGWEVAFDLDPLNLNGVNDADLNDDDDFYALAEVPRYSDYQHLLPVTTLTVRTYDEEQDVIEVQEGVPFETNILGNPIYYYYDPVAKSYCTATVAPDSSLDQFDEEIMAVTYVEPVTLETTKGETGLSFDTVTLNSEPIFLKKKPVIDRLRDNAVYKAFGFSHLRAWSGDTNDTYTQPFVSREEFNSAVVRAGREAKIHDIIAKSTNPTLADTNADGMPDGWAAYVGFDPLDNVMAMKDVDEDGLNNAAEYAMGVDGWTNKTHPTDPNNPDTDFDTVSDGSERAYLANGGMNPTVIDTDGDGMPDGWEHLYGGGATDDRGRPNPAMNHDGDLDYDRDGLTNYQEYLVGLFRHLRFDLSPDQARLYMDRPGTAVPVKDDKYAWSVLPDVYSVVEDLANPVDTYSITYNAAVPVLAQAWAENSSLLATDYPMALLSAFNRLWCTTMAFPTADQAADYGLYTNEEDDQNDLRIAFLQNAIVEFDAAYQRLLTVNGDEAKELVLDRQLRALMTRIDWAIAELKANKIALREPVAALLEEGGDTDTIWAARKDQVVVYCYGKGWMVDKTLLNFELPEGATFSPITDDSGTQTTPTVPSYDYYNLSELPCITTSNDQPDAYKVTDYEAAVYAAECPLLRTTYRAAVRGFNGGLQAGAYFGPLSQHAPIPAFATKFDIATGELTGGRYDLDVDAPMLLGEPVAGEPFAALNMPIQGGRDEGVYFPTTNPLAADTDADGMDDYWEVFHGLNPILGDYANESSSSGGGTYIDDLITTAYPSISGPTGSAPFMAPTLQKGDVTGYDYYTYPWLAGAPFADPDGDGLLNFEEAVNPVASDPAHYGTDPSALWMTDPDNPNAFTTRFYGCINPNLFATDAPADKLQTILPAFSFVYKAYSGEVSPNMADGGFVLPFEINEGYDTDGDGIGDLTELTSTTIYRGDPQSLRTPDRQQAAYFGGAGAMQSFGETQFGPTALTTFTLECWVKPDADQDTEDVVLIDRPWRFTDSPAGDTGAKNLRHNFVLGLLASGNEFIPYVKYTGAGTTYEASDDTPQASPIVTSGETIRPNEWTHIAASYDGKRLVIIINGVETGAANSSLIPANGVIAIKNDGLDDYRRFTYRKAPIIIGATPDSEWFADLDGDERIVFKDDGTVNAAAYAKCYRGFIDEVRIWNGARTASQIAESRRTGFTQAQLLDFRYKAFMARYEGDGFYQANTPAEPLAIYTFNDLLAGERIPADDSDPANPKPATAATEPWERYPGQEMVGDETVPGSFMYRRKGLKNTIATPGVNGYIHANLPELEDVYTSYYTLTAPKNLRSRHYSEGVDGENVPYSEYVPLAHNTVTHLPVADVERVVDEDERINCLLKPDEQDEGSPKLRFPSGSAENLKVIDSVYWTPYAAGYRVSSDKTYNVKTSGNPYAYYYGATYTFDLLNYRTHPGYTFRSGTDLLIYGDVFAKYDFESWDNSPSTDPSAGKTDDPDSVVAEGTNWFEYKEGTGTDYDDIQLSQGGAWLENNVALGQTKDTDGDRMPNWWENYYGLDPEDPTGVNGPHGDDDGDYLTNYAEFLAKANPGKYSTVGNGVPDSQIPIWFRRGRPTFGLLYTDNDMMEDHWEAANRTDRLTVDLNDATGDADGDGWSNFAEARAGFRGSKRSTNPNAATSIAQNGTTVLEMPTPALRLTVDYFGDQNVYTNALEDAQIVVHAYTAKNNNSAPDAIFKLPLGTTANAEEAQSYTQDVGYWHRGVISGYLHIGNIIPGSLKFRYARYMADGDDTVGEDIELLYHDIIADTALTNGEALLYYNREYTDTDEETGEDTTRVVRYVTGKVNYSTGYYEIDFTHEFWPDYWQYTADDGTVTYYENSEHAGTAYYESSVTPGSSCTFTLAKPASGYLKEGKNNFFVFADLNGNGTWQMGEPAGIPDQHDVEIGFDLVNKPLHVAMTEMAPPGAVRLDVKSILDQVMTQLVVETEGNDESAYAAVAADSGEEDGEPLSSVINPSTGDYLKLNDFMAIMDYELVLVSNSTIGSGNVETFGTPTPAYRKQYNTKKPYLTEDEIFSQLPAGLPGTNSPAVRAATYKVYYIPTTLSAMGISSWTDYNIAIVTNKLDALDTSSTALVSPVGSAIRYNTDLAFEWLCNVQVPTFTLTITKTADGSGAAMNTVVYEKTVRGVTPIATAKGTDTTEQYRYRYALPRGIGELSPDGTTVFGNGTYSYTLALNPYNGKSYALSSTFRLQLADSGDADLIELDGAEQDTSYNAQDTHYVRTRVRYNGVLAETADFGGRRIVIEAHYSGSFNGDPIASTSDFLVYDAVDALGAYTDADEGGANRCVRMVKDKIYKTTVANEEIDAFWSTRFDAELRGLPTTDPVYLVAYFDLNGNGARDAWEPWGYATQGLDASSGFYYDPRAVKPVSTGKDYLVEFYIQDVDTDNDKLADSWEWLSSGKPTAPFADWCDTFGAALGHHHGTDIWMDTPNGLSLTAYGAQLYGLTVTGEPDANGAVQVENMPEDLELARELYEILGADAAQALFNDGYLSYGLSIASIVCDGENVTLTWDITSATGMEDGAVRDLTEVFANTKTSAVYAVYGKASIADTAWTKLDEVKVAGVQAPMLTIPLANTTITVDGEQKPAAFFKVILSAKTAEAILAE